MLVGCFGATKLTKHEVNVTRPRQQRVKLGQTLIKRLHVDVFAMIEGGGGIYEIVPAVLYLQMGRVLQIYILCKCRAERIASYPTKFVFYRKNKLKYDNQTYVYVN